MEDHRTDHRTDRLGVLLDQLDRAREIAQARLDGLASPASLPEGEPLAPRTGDGAAHQPRRRPVPRVRRCRAAGQELACRGEDGGGTVRQRPRPAGAAARRAERPTRVPGTIRPDPGSSWSARRPPGAHLAVPAGRLRRPRTNELDAGRLSGRVVFPPGEGIGRTRPGAGSRPRRGRFRPSDRHRRRQLL